MHFSYGARPDLRLNVVLPITYARPIGQRRAVGPGNTELGVKYRVAHQHSYGWDISRYLALQFTR